MVHRPRMTLADYLVIAVSPALVMAMVGSLVFFLVEIFYQGQYEWRLRFVLAMFVVAAVLIGRISIELGTERATLYAMPLAVATALAINRFVVSQGGHLGSLGLAGNLALLGLVWWAAHKLVWDCTFIDESRDYTGEGLLQAAGLQKTTPQESPQDVQAAEPPAELELPEHADPQRAAQGRTGWWRFHRQRSRAHPPGVWIVYFALVALPVFGLGQALIPAADAARRAYGFRLLLIYAASTLGLLLLTSFLGLRRYLRQRWLTMPVRMAAVWVATGAMLIVAVLTVSLLLPRPAAEFSWDDIARTIAGRGHQASRMAWGPEGTQDPRPDRARLAHGQGSGEPAHGQVQTAKPGPTPPATADRPHASAQAPEARAQATVPAAADRTESRPPVHSGKSYTQEGQAEKQGSAKAPESAQAESPAKPGKATRPEKPRPAPDTSRRSRPHGGPDQWGSATGPSRPSPPNGSGPAQSPARPVGSEKQDEPPSPAASPVAPSRVAGGSWTERLAGLIVVLKWAFYAAIAAAVLFWAVRHGREIAAEVGRLLAEWRAWWAGLFGSKAVSAPGVTAPKPDIPDMPAPGLPRLADYADPFLAGTAERMPPDELVRYSFEALEAWGREHGCSRQADQTPTEFAQAVGRVEPTLAGQARTLTGLYCRAAYAGGKLTPRDVEPLKDLWQRLRWSGTPLVDARQPMPLT